MSSFPVQLGLEYNPPAPFGADPPSVQGILSLYRQKLEIRVTLEEGSEYAEVKVTAESVTYTLQVMKKIDGYTVTASDSNGNVKQCSSFPLQERGRYWDTSQ
jgi:hypothetical protein